MNIPNFHETQYKVQYSEITADLNCNLLWNKYISYVFGMLKWDSKSGLAVL